MSLETLALSMFRLASKLRCTLGLCAFLSGCAVANEEIPDQPDAFPTRPDSGGQPEVDAGTTPDAGLTACDQAIASLVFDFEGSEQGFVHGRMPEVADSQVQWTYDHWQHGAPSGETCASGTECWGTNLEGNYIQCQRAFLVSVPMDLSACAQEGRDLRLSFEHRFDFWTGSFNGGTFFDGGRVEISSDGINWVAPSFDAQSPGFTGVIAPNPDMGSSFACVEKNNFYVSGKAGFVGSSGDWRTETIVFPSTLLSSRAQIRFTYGAGVSSQTTDQEESKLGTEAGWFVDHLRFQ